MKTLLFYFLLISISILGFAQPNTPYAPNVVVHDIDGVKHDLHHYLNQNRTVVLEFYNSSKAASINSRPGVEDLYNTVGLGGDLTHQIISIDMDSNTSTEADFRTDYSIQNAIVDSIQNFGAYNADLNRPMFIVICPDRLWKVRFGSIFNDESYITALSASCAPLSTKVKDGKIFKFTKYPQYCDGQAEVSFYFQNYSQSNSLSVAKIFAREGGDYRGDVTWYGDLKPYEIEEVTMEVEGISGIDYIEFELEQIDGLYDTYDANNTIVQFLSEGLFVRKEIEIEIVTDYNPEHINWYVIRDLVGDTVYSNENNNYLANTTYNRTLDFSTHGQGCYELFIEDTFGDGILNGTTPDGVANGKFKVTSDQGDVIFDEIAYEKGTSRKFYIDKYLNISNYIEEINVIKQNPIQSVLNIENMREGLKYISVFSSDGKQIISLSENSSALSIDAKSWENGVYIVSVISDNHRDTFRIVKTE